MMINFKKNIKVTFIIFACSAVLLLPQINQHALILGGDSLFHWNRIYDAMMQIKHENFQYFVSMYGFSQSGRIVNALYGPYVAYFNGLIMLISGSWFKYQIVSDWILNVIAAFSMYYLLRTNKVRQSYSVWLSLLFLTTYSVSTWTLNQQFLAWGTAILPLGIAAATRMVRNTNQQVNILELTLSVSFLIQTHILTAIFLIIILFVFFTFGIIMSQSKKLMMKNITISVVLTILLTSNIWGALLELYTSNKLLAPFKNINPLSNGVVNFVLDNSQISIVLALVIAVQITVLVCYYNKLTIVNRITTVMGTVLFIMSTQLLPWNTIFNIATFTSIIQFPYRLLAPATILLLLGIGLSANELSKSTNSKVDKRTIVLGSLTILSVLISLGNIQNKSSVWQTENVIASRYNVTQILRGDRLRKEFRSTEMEQGLKYVSKPAPDYLPTNNSQKIRSNYDQYQTEIVTNTKFSKKESNGKLIISWISKDYKPITISAVKYNHTKLIFNKNVLKRGDYNLTSIGAIQLVPKVGQNILTLKYVPSHLFEILMIINWISWIGVLFWIGIVYVLKTRSRKKQTIVS